MKTFRYSLLFMLLLAFGFNALAQVEKNKKVDKSYQVKSSTVLEVINKFGKVHVNTWDKSEIAVKVEVIVEDKDDKRAQDLLDEIDIKINESGDRKSFETTLSKGFKSKGKQSFEVNYEISMPSGNPLELKNSFGNIYLGDRTGATKLDLSYGDLKAGKLTGESDFKLSFGKGDVDELGSGTMTIKYSKLEIAKVGDVKLKQGFSDLEIDEIGKVDLESKYGSLDFGTVESIDGSAGFSGFEIDRLKTSIKLEASYVSGFTIDELAKGFDFVDIEGKFGNYRITLEDGSNASVEGEFRFSTMSYDKDEINMHYVNKDMHRATYKGKVGNGSGGQISVVSSYGDLRLGF